MTATESRELRLRQRIDDLQDKIEKLERSLARTRLANHRLHGRMTWLRSSREVWRVRALRK